MSSSKASFSASKPSSSTPPPQNKQEIKSTFNSKPKLLYVADSVGHTVSVKELENSSDYRIRTAKAYSSVYDDKARWPEANFTDFVKYALQNPGRDNFDVLVLSAPTSRYY